MNECRENGEVVEYQADPTQAKTDLIPAESPQRFVVYVPRDPGLEFAPKIGTVTTWITTIITRSKA